MNSREGGCGRYGVRACLAVTLFLALAAPARLYGVTVLPGFVSVSVVEPVLALSLLFVGSHVLQTKKICVGPPLLFGLLSLPVLLAVLSLLWTIAPGDTFKAIVVQSEAVLGYIAAINLLYDLPFDLQLRALGAFGVGLLLSSLFSYVPIAFFEPQFPPGLPSSVRAAWELSYHARLSHPFIGLSNNFATILAFVVPIFYSLWLARRSKWWGLMAGVSAAALVATMSRGVLLALILAFGSVSAWNVVTRRKISKRAAAMTAGLVLAAAFGGAVFLLASHSALQNLSGRISVSTIDQRFDAYAAAWRAIESRPVVGYGSGVSLHELVHSVSLTSVHDTYIQGMLWYGIPLGVFYGFVLILLPAVGHRLPAGNAVARAIRNGVFIALLTQILIYVTETSWQGSMLRVIVYALIASGVSLVRASNQIESRAH